MENSQFQASINHYRFREIFSYPAERHYRDRSMSESKSGEEKVEVDAKATPLNGDQICEKVSKYFYEDDTLAKTFEDFIDSKADLVDLDSPEYKLKYTEVYEQYKELFEDKIGTYIEKELGSSIELFYETPKADR